MSGWDFGSNNENQQKAEFTKFPVGITKIRVVDAEPYVRWTHWMPQHKRSVNCPGKDCPICQIRKQQKANKETPTYGMSRRLAINVLNRETKKVEILEQGVTFFEDLRDIMSDLKEEDKVLQDVDIKVRRRGTGKDDTSYRIDLDEEYALTNEDLKLIEGKVDLKEYFKPHTFEQITRLVRGEAWEEVMKSEQEDEAPFDEDEEKIELR